MKKLLITLISLLLLINTNSQLKHFFPDSNSYFSVSWMKFWFEGDTVIGDYTYKKVYMQSGDSIADFNKSWYFTAIREDTIAKKVYFFYDKYPASGAEEYLLYDFSVNVGDEVSFYSLWPFWYPEHKQRVVHSLDSILVDDNYRKKINFKSTIFWGNIIDESWIEGIGSTNGLFFAGEFDMADVMDNTYLLCVHEDDRIIYKTNDQNICFLRGYGVGNNDKNRFEVFKVYPTIVDKELYIETNKNIEDFDYKIINMQGQIIINEKFSSKTVDVSKLHKGFYLIVISDKNNKNNKIEKFIKH